MIVWIAYQNKISLELIKQKELKRVFMFDEGGLH